MSVDLRAVVTCDKCGAKSVDMEHVNDADEARSRCVEFADWDCTWDDLCPRCLTDQEEELAR